MNIVLRSAIALLAGGLSLPGMAAPVTPMHGAMEVPASRQLACHKAGDYNWPLDGSAIKSPGCRAAYQHVYKKFDNDASQAVFQFNQWHEVSKNVSDYRNMDAVKAAIPDGQLCSAGNHVAPAKRNGLIAWLNKLKSLLGFRVLVNDKSGLDVAADWRAYDLQKDANNKVQMHFKIMAEHNPSYWEIYVSKDGYDASTRPMKWDDLELVAQIGDTQPSNGYYLLDVDLKNYTGKRVIYTRWQRDDAAGEGFYNCSDVNIVAAK
ncbi:MAG: lytic polysaccharide monooxygenase [Pseudomonas farsensis]|uniref:lytic polysaccharide monooxygenase n=1 Tax=Pseudomonas farsensis TaxID=2745492 RepID=UPI003C7E420A